MSERWRIQNGPIAARYVLIMGDSPHDIRFGCFNSRPNWFNRVFQYLIFGFRWEKINEL